MNQVLTDKQLQELCNRIGFNAVFGETSKEGKYQANVNALGKSVPIEWVRNLIIEVQKQEELLD